MLYVYFHLLIPRKPVTLEMPDFGPVRKFWSQLCIQRCPQKVILMLMPTEVDLIKVVGLLQILNTLKFPGLLSAYP